MGIVALGRHHNPHRSIDRRQGSNCCGRSLVDCYHIVGSVDTGRRHFLLPDIGRLVVTRRRVGQLVLLIDSHNYLGNYWNYCHLVAFPGQVNNLAFDSGVVVFEMVILLRKEDAENEINKKMLNDELDFLC